MGLLNNSESWEEAPSDLLGKVRESGLFWKLLEFRRFMHFWLLFRSALNHYHCCLMLLIFFIYTEICDFVNTVLCLSNCLLAVSTVHFVSQQGIVSFSELGHRLDHKESGYK
jgi:hypothetical protein